MSVNVPAAEHLALVGMAYVCVYALWRVRILPYVRRLRTSRAPTAAP